MPSFKKRISGTNKIIQVDYPLVLETLLNMDILQVCILDSRTHNILYNKGIHTMGHLCCLSYDRLIQFPGIGIKRANNLVSELSAMGLSLNTNPSEEQ